MNLDLGGNNFYLTHLYPKELNIYGDRGNILALKWYLSLLQINLVIQEKNPDSAWPKYTDMYFIGGGQDKEQEVVSKDLIKDKNYLINQVNENNKPLLSICGGYQLLGEEFISGDGTNIEGVGLFPVKTMAQSTDVKLRCTGNLLIESKKLNSRLLGFENHSGQTFFTNTNNQDLSLGDVIIGHGNNINEKKEGCVVNKAIGTYMHGSFLPKNTEVIKWLLEDFINRKGLTEENNKINIDSSIEAKKIMITKLLN
jgi:lipid II isoglutaminyl synthase (glutamine-hydrolysing)